MNAKKIDLINIALVVLSLIVAIKIPFELFLFSYIILGPLHYLTEITWLHKKNYFFSATKKWSIIFILLAILLSIYPTVKFFDFGISQSIEDALKLVAQHDSFFLLTGFLFAVGLIFFNRGKYLTLMLLLIIPIAFLSLTYLPNLFLFIGVFLPTLIHVYLFTLLFILYGAIKTKSIYGVYLASTLLLVPFIISYIPIDKINYQPSKETIDTFASINVMQVSAFIAKISDELQDGKFKVFSVVGIRIQVFISFAYTYHYLNWFSKTSIIGWKNAISKKRILVILFIWMVSIGLYMYDFKTGLVALFFLSILHVFLEFPLNVTTIKEIVLLAKVKRR